MTVELRLKPLSPPSYSTPAGNAAGNADAASLSSIPTGSAPSNMLINGMLVLVASLAGLAML